MVAVATKAVAEATVVAVVDTVVVRMEEVRPSFITYFFVRSAADHMILSRCSYCRICAFTCRYCHLPVSSLKRRLQATEVVPKVAATEAKVDTVVARAAVDTAAATRAVVDTVAKVGIIKVTSDRIEPLRFSTFLLTALISQ